jgi:hypothetical protein
MDWGSMERFYKDTRPDLYAGLQNYIKSSAESQNNPGSYVTDFGKLVNIGDKVQGNGGFATYTGNKVATENGELGPTYQPGAGWEWTPTTGNPLDAEHELDAALQGNQIIDHGPDKGSGVKQGISTWIKAFAPAVGGAIAGAGYSAGDAIGSGISSATGLGTQTSNAIGGAVAGAATNAATQYATTGRLDLTSLATSAAMGGASGYNSPAGTPAMSGDSSYEQAFNVSGLKAEDMGLPTGYDAVFGPPQNDMTYGANQDLTTGGRYNPDVNVSSFPMDSAGQAHTGLMIDPAYDPTFSDAYTPNTGYSGTPDTPTLFNNPATSDLTINEPSSAIDYQKPETKIPWEKAAQVAAGLLAPTATTGASTGGKTPITINNITNQSYKPGAWDMYDYKDRSKNIQDIVSQATNSFSQPGTENKFGVNWYNYA